MSPPGLPSPARAPALSDLGSCPSPQGPRLPQTPEVQLSGHSLRPPSPETPASAGPERLPLPRVGGCSRPYRSPSGPDTSSRKSLGPSLWGPESTTLSPAGRRAPPDHPAGVSRAAGWTDLDSGMGGRPCSLTCRRARLAARPGPFSLPARTRHPRLRLPPLSPSFPGSSP